MIKNAKIIDLNAPGILIKYLIIIIIFIYIIISLYYGNFCNLIIAILLCCNLITYWIICHIFPIYYLMGIIYCIIYSYFEISVEDNKIIMILLNIGLQFLQLPIYLIIRNLNHKGLGNKHSKVFK